jgi:carbon-monoxide dehydrogenase medium subunit
MKAAAFDYIRAATLAEAGALLTDPGAKLLAGGQSLVPMMNLRLARPGRLIDIKHTVGLRDVTGDAHYVCIGAAWTHADIEDGAFEDPTRGLLPHVARGIAYRAVRNRGTLGGSLAHADPAADWVTTMAALGAICVVHRADGRTVRVAGDAFVTGAYVTCLGATDVLAAVQVPRLSARARWGYHKICRKTGEFAKAIGVAIHDPGRLTRVVAGAVDGPPVVLSDTAAALAQSGPAAAIERVSDEIARRLAQLSAADRPLHVVSVQRALSQIAT